MDNTKTLNSAELARSRDENNFSKSLDKNKLRVYRYAREISQEIISPDYDETNKEDLVKKALWVKKRVETYQIIQDSYISMLMINGRDKDMINKKDCEFNNTFDQLKLIEENVFEMLGMKPKKFSDPKIDPAQIAAFVLSIVDKKEDEKEKDPN